MQPEYGYQTITSDTSGIYYKDRCVLSTLCVFILY